MKEYADEIKRSWSWVVTVLVAALMLVFIINLAVINAVLYSRGNWMANQNTLMLDRFTGTEGKALIERVEKLEEVLGVDGENENSN